MNVNYSSYNNVFKIHKYKDIFLEASKVKLKCIGQLQIYLKKNTPFKQFLMYNIDFKLHQMA